MKYPKLMPYEMKIINFYVIHRDRVKAYRLGHTGCASWKNETVERKANEFFDSDRIKYYRGFQDGGIKVIDEDDVKDTELLLHEAHRVPAVGAHHNGGYPSKYRPEFPEMLLNFFDVDPSQVVETTEESTGKVTREVIINALPTKAGFAAKLRVSSATLQYWADAKDEHGHPRYPEFTEAWDIVDDMIENILVSNTLMNHYNASFAQLYAKNKLRYKDRQDLTLEGGDKPIKTINANMTPEEAAIIYRESLMQEQSKK